MQTLSPSGKHTNRLKDVPHLETSLSPTITMPTNMKTSDATIKKSMPSSLTEIPTNTYSSVTHVEKNMSSTQSSEPEFLPKITPTFHPASFVPNHCNLSKEERKNIIMKKLRSVSKEIITGSFQDLAASWLIEEDSICPNERNINHLKQRYILAIFYYSVHGDQWKLCRKSDMKCSQNSFLSLMCECKWFGEGCNQDGFVTKIDFGKQA